MKEEHIFHHALEFPPGQRAAYLDKACGPDVSLRERVEILLQAYDHPGSFLAAPGRAAGAEATLGQPSERPGTQIGSYKLLQQIGEGGMGAVYMAEQTEPVERRVALKIIKPGMDTRLVIARFEAERQALAMMDHPNIAKVFDAGTTESGRPYFVMELVRGVPITKYCDEHQLNLKARLELFLPVCQAVQHAHQKGIIHRDLKPSNVLIAQYDDRPVPKVIDFGVAKAAQKLTERTMFTEFGQVVGTLEYMSPEQAQLNQLDIDTRSDIYSLGVLLYELLTGCTPFDGKRLRSAAFDEMLRIIREEDPPKPSTRPTSAETLPFIAANRNVEPARLSRTIRGELDWIVMKALEKDRNRRYETANGFAQDLLRYLNDEPVQACPPTAGYRLRKFARKNRSALSTATAFIILLVAAVLVSTWQAIRARQAEIVANANADKARLNAEEAKRNARQAHNEANAKEAALEAERHARADETKARLQAETYRDLGWKIPPDMYNAACFMSRCIPIVAKHEKLNEQQRREAVQFYGDAAMRHLREAAAQGYWDVARMGKDTDLDPLRERKDFQTLQAELELPLRARPYIGLSRWDEAAAEYAQANLPARPLSDDTFCYACLFLIRGDNEGYNCFCRRIIERAEEARLPPHMTYILARTCAMAINNEIDPAQTVEWANLAVAGGHNPWEHHVLGLARYRAGQFERALQAFTEANVESWDQRDLNCFGLALVHHRLDNREEARRCFDKGVQWLERQGPPGPGWPAKLLPQDWLEAQLLRREAEELLSINRSS